MTTDMKNEITAGIAVFLATAYIVVVNPIILSQAGMPFPGVVTATVLITSISTLLMGFWAKNPILVAPGMGINAYFTFSVVIGMGVAWQTALGMVFWSGVFFLLLSITNVRSHILMAIPVPLRIGISCGIGVFIALIGLVNAGVIVANPATLISLGSYSFTTLIFTLGLLVTAALIIRKVPGALILGILITTLLAWPIGRWAGDASALNHGVATLVNWKGLFQAPDFSLVFQADILGSLKWIFVPIIFSFIFTDLFDSLSTFMAVAYSGNLLDENGNPRNLKKSLIVDAISTLISGLLGSSAGTSYIESTVGIEQGGKTGWVAVTAGLCFLPLLFFSPLLSMVPPLATAPILVLVGASMMRNVKDINWHDLTEALPVFLSIIIIPLTYSITNGIVWGMLSFSLLKLLSGKQAELTPAMIATNLFILTFLFI